MRDHRLYLFHRPESGGSFIVVADVVSLGVEGGDSPGM